MTFPVLLLKMASCKAMHANHTQLQGEAHPHPHNTVQDAQCKQSLRALPGQHLCLTSCPPTGKGHTGESRSSGYRAGEPSSVVEHLPDRCESLGSAFSTGYQGTRDRTAMRPLSKMEKPGPGNFKDPRPRLRKGLTQKLPPDSEFPGSGSAPESCQPL